MSFDGRLFLGLLVVLGVMQVVCWLLAHGLGRRLERHVMVLGIALPLLLLFPWIDPTRLLVPSDILQLAIPLPPRVAATHRHDLLNDAVYQFLPWELEVRHALSDLRLPLWSDNLEGGSSPWINPQASPVSPIAMPARALPIQHFFLVTLALKILVAFQGTWVLARTVGVSRLSSLLAGAGFAFGGGIMAWALFPHTATLAWVPWLTAAVIRLFRGGGAVVGRSRMVGTAAVLTAALLLSGHPETAALGGVFAAICGLSLARRRTFFHGLGSAALAALLGLGLAAPHVLPFALHLPHSQRAQETLVRELPYYEVHLQAPWTWFLPGFGRMVLSSVNPRVFGRPYLDKFHGPFNWAESESGYAGLVALAGSAVALLALRRSRRRKSSWPFLAFAVLSLLLAAQFIPLAHVIYSVEALKTVAWSRILLVGSLGLAVAGGMGIDRLLRARRRTAGWIAVALAAALSLAVHADPYVIALWVLILAAAFLGRKRPALAAAGLALVLVLDLGPWARGHLPSTNPALFFPVTDFMALLKQESTQGGPWRVVGEERMLFPSLLAVYGIADARTHNPLAPMPYLRTMEAAFGFAPTTANYFPAFRGLDHPFLDFLNVRVVTSVAEYKPPRTMERIDGGRFEHYRLYRNPDALPRWFLPSAAETIAEEELGRWVSSLTDPRRVAVFDGRAAGWAERGQRGEIRLAALAPGRIALDVPGSGDRLLATSLLMPEGWSAGPLETVVVNGAFVGVHVPPGASRVELRFVPPGLVAGFWIGGLSLLATSLFVAYGLKDRRP
ncbi:MAG TPA: hypothetical protein VNM67_00425 [Thermoanaerobaculia bacterium]|jgi:hypothetical protein|nr:hypothetical protein [Thermoanaerobaculia bacterium]